MIEELRAARWFGGKSREIRDTRIIDRACWADDATVSIMEISYGDGSPDTYVLADRVDEPGVASAILERVHGEATIATEAGGKVVFRKTGFLNSIRPERLEPIALMRGEQSNTSIRFGDALILKLFRRLQYGPNPDVEIGTFLTEHTSFRGSPPVAGSVEYLDSRGEQASLALVQAFERNRGDAWTTTLARVRSVLDGADPDESVAALARLGQTTAELHVALASGEGDFSAEPITLEDVNQWRAAIYDEVRAAVDGLARKGVRVDVEAVLHKADDVATLVGALKARHHGDYHLGQVLELDDGSFVIIDFEGEPAKPLAQRREKRSPLRDVAGMLRSFDYARNSALRSVTSSHSGAARRANEWYEAVREAFLSAYLATARQRPGLLPAEVDKPLAALELEKAAYEVLYELNNRPDWLDIPLTALTSA